MPEPGLSGRPAKAVSPFGGTVGSNPTPSAMAKLTLEEWFEQNATRLEYIRDICKELGWLVVAKECDETLRSIRRQLGLNQDDTRRKD